MRLLLIFFIFIHLTGYAQGSLMVYPKRVEFDAGHDRVKTVQLVNNGQDTAYYRILFSETEMLENGNLVEVSDKQAENSAQSFIRIFPKHIKIAPRQSQVVKLQLTHKTSLEAGEYRSHLVLRNIPQKSKSPMENSKSADHFKIELKPSFGYGIPIIIKKGNVKLDVTLDNVELKIHDQSNQAVASFNILRNGAFSPYGSVKLTYKSTDGDSEKLFQIKGVAVYSPLAGRKMKLEFDLPKHLDYKKGQISIDYLDAETQLPYASKALNLAHMQ